MPERGITRIVGQDLIERPLIAGEVDDLRGDAGPLRQADLRQIVREEFGAAAHVIERKFGAVGLFTIAAAPQVTHIMEQRQDHAGGGPLGGQLARGVDLAFVAGEQPCHRQRDILRIGVVRHLRGDGREDA